MKSFKPYNPEQPFLLPPDLRDWLPESHLASFVSDVVEALDLSEIYSTYERGSRRGQPPYQERSDGVRMMVKLLVYGYCTGKLSSRKLERATWEEVPFRVLAANQHPDHDTLAAFRKRHLKALKNLFLQVLRLCQEAGLVKLGHVSIDGTKLSANASKHKAMSYERMEPAEAKLRQEIDELLAEAQRVDASEDAKFGKGKRGDEIPFELQRRGSRLAKIQQAKAALEAEAKARAELVAQEARLKVAAREQKEALTGRKMGGSPAKILDPAEAKPDPKAQKNFTDPESRIMPDKGGFSQAYNAQIAVDEKAQIIVASAVTQQVNDKQQLPPMLEAVNGNLERLPEKTSADAGYFSAEAIGDKRCAGTDLFVPPQRQKHGQTDAPEEPTGTQPHSDLSRAMRDKLQTVDGKAVYKQRKAIVEPVFGQIKEARRIRRFSFRGLENVAAEWDIICWTHNLLKLFRSGGSTAKTRNPTHQGSPERAASRNSSSKNWLPAFILNCLLPVPCSLFPVRFPGHAQLGGLSPTHS